MKASIAIQIMPKGVEDSEKIRIIDCCIDYIAKTGLNYEVGPFETAIEGDSVEELLDIVKELQDLGVREGAKTMATFMKLWHSPKGVMTIEEKTEKHKH